MRVVDSIDRIAVMDELVRRLSTATMRAPQALTDLIDDVFDYANEHAEQGIDLHYPLPASATKSGHAEAFPVAVTWRTEAPDVHALEQPEDITKCSACGGQDFDPATIDTTTEGISVETTCNNCGAQWVDYFTLKGREAK